MHQQLVQQVRAVHGAAQRATRTQPSVPERRLLAFPSRPLPPHYFLVQQRSLQQVQPRIGHLKQHASISLVQLNPGTRISGQFGDAAELI